MKPDLKLMREFAAQRENMTRKDAIAAARWMLAYAMDMKHKFRHGRLSRTR